MQSHQPTDDALIADLGLVLQPSAPSQSSPPKIEQTEGREPHQLLWEAMAEQQRELHTEEITLVCTKLREAIALRDRYRQPTERDDAAPRHVASASVIASDDGAPGYDAFSPPRDASGGARYAYERRHGVFYVWDASHEPPPGGRRLEDSPFEAPPDVRRFTRDLSRLMRTCGDAAVNSFCYHRLRRLESRFALHVMENEQAETAEQRKVPHRDFYNVRKVDTHIHLSAAMNQKHLLRFIKRKAKKFSDEVVARDARGAPMTLASVLDELGTTPYHLNLDALGMHADESTFCRFDKFNLKYNPLGQSQLRNIFLKTDNEIGGRYFAELTRELFDDLAESKYQFTEYRISIYGRSRAEWDSLADWIVDHRLYSDNNRWVIQVPRLYGMYHAKGMVGSFAEFLDNLFAPLFEVSVDPRSHPKLHLMLQQVVAFDSVDDESKPEVAIPTLDAPAPAPESWTSGNPHYSTYLYYLYANLFTLNQLRRARGFSTFCLRPHAGESGELNHLHATFLCARGINHGINLRRAPALEYLYYLCQVGLALSPLSNNALFLRLSKNPFYEFFATGLNVSLSTDDPLMFHHTKEPLMEEYCVAKQVWRLSSSDLAEIARNSVLQSSFEPCVKASWLGGEYDQPGVEGNDIARTNLPNLRVRFRHARLTEERRLILECQVSPCAIAHLDSRMIEEDPEAAARVTTADIAAAHNAQAPHARGSPLSPFDQQRRASRSTEEPRPGAMLAARAAKNGRAALAEHNARVRDERKAAVAGVGSGMPLALLVASAASLALGAVVGVLAAGRRR